ncbi:hypothetical protein D3C79_883320 [compost metagenome]
MHGAGHLLVLGDLPGEAQLRAMGHQPTAQIRCYAPGDDEADAAAGPLGIEGGQLVEAALLLFEAGVHGAHQDSVLKLGKAEIERGQKRRVTAHHEFLFEASAQESIRNTRFLSWVKPRSRGVSRVG